MHASGVAVLAATVLGLASCAAPTKATDSPLRWGSCDAVTNVYAAGIPGERLARLDFRCGTLQVPLDPANADGETVRLQLITAHQTGRTSSTSTDGSGSLLLIPGGPGQSGVDNHAFLVGRMPERLLAGFDVIGFDPRGVGHSEPIHCEHTRTTPQLPDLSTDEGYERSAALARKGAQECRTSLGDRASVFGTTAAAADIDRIRTALGQSRLTFVGGSYGAKLGAEYARQFPTKVRAGVLDAPTDPTTSSITTAEHQVGGFEDSVDEFVDWCAAQKCRGLGSVRAFLADLVALADRTPIPSGRPSGDEPLRGSQVLDAVVAAMYDDARWPDLAAGLVEARDGDSGTLWDLVDAGQGSQDTIDANFVVNCTDSAPGPTEDEIRSSAARFRKQFPTLGAWGSWQLFGCSAWTAERHTLANSSVLLTWEGSGHTAFTRNACIDDALAEYLLTLNPPPADTRCPT